MTKLEKVEKGYRNIDATNQDHGLAIIATNHCCRLPARNLPIEAIVAAGKLAGLYPVDPYLAARGYGAGHT